MTPASTMLAVFPGKDRLAHFGADREDALLASFAELPDGPTYPRRSGCRRVIGTTDYPSITRRRIVAPGVALIGDAAMVGDPVWGTGCGWAFQSAEWLADAVSGPLHSRRRREVDRAARRYQRKHRRMLLPHQLINIDFSRRSASIRWSGWPTGARRVTSASPIACSRWARATRRP